MITRALMFALALRHSLSLALRPDVFAFPLIDIGNYQFTQTLSLFLAFLLSLVWLKGKDGRWIYLVLALTCLLSWVSNYSQTGAFHLHVVFLCLYMFFWEGEPDEGARRTLTISFISSVFIAAGVFKLNPQFLSGIEFTSKGNFFVFLGENRLTEKPAALLASFVVLLELAVGVLVWIRPRLVIQLILISLLGLTFVHPRVSYVYFCFLPFYFHLIEREWPQKLANPFLWFFFLILMKPHYGTVLENWYVLAISAFLLVGHLRLLFSEVDDRRNYRISLKSLRPAGIVILSAILAILGAPSPIGYTMFSGQHGSPSLHELTFQSSKVCSFLSRGLLRTSISDVKFESLQNFTTCVVKHPTVSGAGFVKRFICQFDRNVVWEFKSKESSEPVREDCSKRGLVQ